MGRIAILTEGLWALREEVSVLTGMTPVRHRGWRQPSFDAVAGWGHAPTARAARRLAVRNTVPYVAIEDGPLRSLCPGPRQRPLGMVADRSGIYYDMRTPNDLAAALADEASLTPALMGRAAACAAEIRRLRLSKYNAGPERDARQLGLGHGAHVLVLDQVRDDASVAGAWSGAASFTAMLTAAREENPAAEIVVKVHPDVTSGRRRGYLDRAAEAAGCTLVRETVNPWSLVDLADTVYTVSSGLGFEATLAGKRVVCFGAPFYAGWGFTDDRSPHAARPRKAPPLDVFAAYYLLYARYFDAYSRRPIEIEDAIDQLARLRDRFQANGAGAVCYRIARWKRRAVDTLLDGPAGRPPHMRDAGAAVRLAAKRGTPLVVWASRDNRRIEAACRTAGVGLRRVEDGFIRSAGLGASFVSPRSLVLDDSGIYYDATAPSDLETLLQTGEIPGAIVERARRLRERLVAAGTTKYNVGAGRNLAIDSGGRAIVLVPGQVEDDASITRGSPRIKRNAELLAAVRARHPDAFIVYKPHPDVEAGFRRGKVTPREVAAFADRVVTRASIVALIEACERVETMTSLAGFEALLRGKPVTTHGQPFYAGWGLTEDLAPVPRRTRRCSIDELTAAALLLYPRYLDPKSGLPCEAERTIALIAEEVARSETVSDRLFRQLRVAAARTLRLSQAVGLVRRGT
jgi:capsular polysaccharide export protein